MKAQYSDEIYLFILFISKYCNPGRVIAGVGTKVFVQCRCGISVMYLHRVRKNKTRKPNNTY